MKKLFFFIALFAASFEIQAQLVTYDVLTATVPEGWTKVENLNSNINYTTINQQKKAWCRVALYKHTTATGNLQTDFNKEWSDIVISANPGVSTPVLGEPMQVSGWSALTGTGQFRFDNRNCTVMLRTFMEGNRCASVMTMTNDPSLFDNTIQSFLASVSLVAPTPVEQPALQNNVQQPVSGGQQVEKPMPVATGFQFNSTNFDDGWTSVVKEDWVEVVKGDIRVLLHYPHPEEKVYRSQQDESTRFFWNLFVAPRYSNLRNFELLNYNMSYEPGHFAGGLLTDNKTGKDVWVTLFNKGKGGWIEIITKDKQSFVNAFGINNPDTYFSDWDPLVKLSGYNKFAVGQNDLAGKWSSDFTSSNSYYNVYTGIYAGSSTYASRVTFIFLGNNKYKYEASSASGYTGTRMDVQQAKSSGAYKHMGDWQLWFPEIEKKARTYNAYFSCVKGGRLLWLQDTGYGSYTAYGKVE
jgi:hypothetical protein